MDLAMLDLLARLTLLVRRHGGDLAIDEVPVELAELVELAGLTEVLLRPPGEAAG